MSSWGAQPISSFRVLALTQGGWGKRIAKNIRTHAPGDWSVEAWQAPRALPLILDEPEDYLPATLPAADLILALSETPALAQLVPDVCRRTGAGAVIAPIDFQTSLPAGLARQLDGWLREIGVAVVFPRPFCSLRPTAFNRYPHQVPFDDPHIRRFADCFGNPEFRIEVVGGQISRAHVLRDAACGCARHVAENLLGTPVGDALEKAGMLHHHFPCLASMDQDLEYHDTLMHVSGNILKDAIHEALKNQIRVAYLRPNGHVTPEQPKEQL